MTSNNDISLPAAEQNPMTEEQKYQAIKQYLYNQFCEKYHEFCKFLNSIPFDQKLKDIVIKEFDDGYLWAKEAFTTLKLPQMAEQKPETNPSDKIEIVTKKKRIYKKKSTNKKKSGK